MCKDDIPNEKMAAINDCFRYQHIHSGVKHLIGEWAISSDGDLVFVNTHGGRGYAIFSNNLEMTSPNHIKSRSWCADADYEDFCKAFEMALNIKREKEVNLGK